MISLGSSDAEVLAEMKAIRELFALKYVMRYQSVRDMTVHSESVAEHLIGMEILSTYFLPLEDPTRKLDALRVYELILFHELGEIETGDILFHKKSHDQKLEEREAAKRVAARLPESLQTLALDRSREFDDCKTPEAKFADAIDKIEPVFHLFEDVGLQLFKKLGISKNVAITNKIRATEPFPYMRHFLDAWTARAVSLDVFPEVE
jgi:putative hydrolase of HD superfamily